MTTLADLKSDVTNEVMHILLKDRTTNKNIFLANNELANSESITTLTRNLILNNLVDIRLRVSKSKNEQNLRTRKNAEVFTPAWICNHMNNHYDTEWFGKENVFNQEQNTEWIPNSDKIEFPEGKTWQEYVCSRVLEITCGEAPFLVSRYDAVTGNIIPLEERIGILDRKLRVINENIATRSLWNQWVYRAFESVYGYEYQGDNLLIARINLIETFLDYFQAKWGEIPDHTELKKVANIISWNIWQMDGLQGAVPCHDITVKERPLMVLIEDNDDFSLFSEIPQTIECRLTNWRDNTVITYNNLMAGLGMKFDFAIGNPPYQEQSNGNNANDTPIYHYFLNAAYQIATQVEMIHPARFLSQSGGTPEKWNNQMLNDKHLKILQYFPKSVDVFPNTDIKGGLAITYRNSEQEYGKIGIFTPCKELMSILKKVYVEPFQSLADSITNRGIYKYSDLAYQEEPDELSKTSDKRIAPSSFERMPKIFQENVPDDNHEYVQILGNINRERTYRWVRKDFVLNTSNLYKYKVVIPKGVGNGVLGESLGTPLILNPFVGFTETYISIGEFDSLKEAQALLKYIKTKFTRIMLGILKVTQNQSKRDWKYVPLQDFTDRSDIDWQQSVSDIDRQLYHKYHLSSDDIQFIDSTAKEMA